MRSTNRIVQVVMFLSVVAVSTLISSCTKKRSSTKKDGPLFSLLDPGISGIQFANTLAYDEKFNIYTYRNFYNGAGVAIGDVNLDSMPDIFFSSNMGDNKLFLNKGNFKFEDVTAAAGVAGKGAWSTGVTMADVNGDGWLDIYVCNSGDVAGDNKKNELFINQQNGTFTEQAETYGLADEGYTTHSVFFDYDHDGDLDCYILNNSYQAIGSFNLQNNVRETRDAKGGDKLLRNDDNHFSDVSEAAGIYGSVIGFGLGVTVSDLNLDGWPDIYVSNDFFERDYIYINQKDGTFTEELESRVGSISAASMGADIADINNDLLPDIFVTEMLPGKDQRLKTKTTFDNWNRYMYNVNNDYYHQFTRNTLQLNNGNGTFSEISRFAGVEATDWSWGALLADLDNDGWKDLFIANGIYKDLTDQDFLNYIADEDVIKTMTEGNKVDYQKLIGTIPSEPISNYAFKNTGDLKFQDVTSSWGLDQPGFSNGSAYGDLDMDGDLDLVVNNVNMDAFVYRNNEQEQGDKNHYVQLHLQGSGKNKFAIGSKVIAYHNDQKQYFEYMPMKGFESSMEYLIHIGLGTDLMVDSLIIIAPFGNQQILYNLKADTTLWIDVDRYSPHEFVATPETSQCLQDITKAARLDFVHKENAFIDFDRDLFLFTMKSTEGPHVATDDINGDGLEDVVFGGAKGQATTLYVQTAQGTFAKKTNNAFETDKECEDTDLILFDLDGDKDLDLFVCSGGNETTPESSQTLNRLYINDGKGNFTKAGADVYAAKYISSGSVAAGDMDGDGDEDLFVGERLKPFAFGVPCDGFIYRNDQGKLTDVSASAAPDLKNLGMITDAVWNDMDGDGKQDLVICGEFMPVTIFKNNGGTFTQHANATLTSNVGWWNTIEIADLNGDQMPDIIGGNHGTNSRFRVTEDSPVCMYVNDFDKNGSVEQIICTYYDGASYPLILRHDLLSRIPSLKKKFLTYKEYANKQITEIFTPQQMENTIKLEATCLESSIFYNQWPSFTREALSPHVQFSPVYSIAPVDVNQDSAFELITGGNLFGVKPEIGRFDASDGIMLTADEEGNYGSESKSSHLCIKGEIRDIDIIDLQGKKVILVARNNQSALIFELP